MQLEILAASMLKVAFNARLLANSSLRGWNRYTVNLLAHLPAHGVELFLYSDRPIHESHLARLPADSFRVRTAQMRYTLWEQIWLPRQCRRDAVDILHCPFHFGLPWFSPCPRVVTLHDAIDVAFAQRRRSLQDLRPAVWKSRLHHWIARTRAEQVITVSEHARGDLIKYLRIRPERITVIPEAADPIFHQPVTQVDRLRIQTQHKLERPYFFYVGGWEERKNIPFFLRAFAAARLQTVDLVLAGGKQAERDSLLALASSLGVAEQVRLLDWVPDVDLPALYSGALAFVYPSCYEGFGLQLVEAMAVGCPVLAARATSLPEVIGDGGGLFSLNEPGELVRFLRKLSTDLAGCVELKAKARERVAQFSWSLTAEKTVSLYSDFIKRTKAC